MSHPNHGENMFWLSINDWVLKHDTQEDIMVDVPIM